MGSNLKAQLKSLIAAKEYRAAIVLLEGSTLPEKATYIQRIMARMAEEVPAVKDTIQRVPETVKGKPLPGTGDAPEVKQAGGCQHVARLVIFTIVAIPVIFLAGHAVNSYINRYQWRMEGVCQDVYRDDWIDDVYTFSQWYYGCQGAAAQSLYFYGQEIAYCFNNHNGTDRQFQQCLADEGVRIYSEKLREAAP